MKKRLIIMIVLLFGMITFVSAKTNDTKVRVDYLENVYGNFKIGDLFYWNQIGLTYANNKIAYCLEPGEWITGAVYDSYTDFLIKDINQKQKEDLELIAYYGYEYKGHQTVKYYLATQELIWRYLGIKEMYWTTGSEHNGAKIDVQAEISEIKKLINSHKNKPSFDGETKEAVLGLPLELVDTNNVLKDYSVILPTSNKITIKDNKLVIEPNKIGNTTISFLRYPNAYQASLIYTKNNSQTLGTFGLSNKVVSNVNLNVKGYHLTIHKKDKDSKTNIPSGDASLEGAIYEITNNLNYKNTLVTNENGVAVLDDVPAGTYNIKEIKASEGYLIDPEIYTIVLNKDKNLEVKMDVFEQVIKNEIELIKVFSDGGTGILKPEISIKFGIFKKDGTLYKEVVTDSFGALKVKLPYGTYTVKQLNTLPNYQKVDDFEIHVTEKKNEVIKYVLHDKLISSKLKIKKIDDHGNPIKQSGVTFKIKNVDTGEYVKQLLTYPHEILLEEFLTNENGEIILPYVLPAGNYLLEEIKAPDEYILSEPIDFSINENTNYEKTEDGLLYTINVVNKKKKGKLKILKQGTTYELEQNDNGLYESKKKVELLSNVEFTLFAETEISENNTIIYQKGDVVEILKTINGEALSKDLPLGSYCFKESKTIDGYKLDSTLNCFTLKEDKNKDEIIEEFSLMNYQDTTEIVIEKSEEVMTKIEKGKGIYEKQLQKGISFGLYNNETIIVDEKEVEKNTLLMSEETNEDGIIKFMNIPFGKYVIRELTKKEEYQDLKQVEVEVTKDNNTLYIPVINKKKKGSILVVKQDSNGTLLSGAEFKLSKSDETIVYKDTVGITGILEINNLEYGTYYLEELKAPDGYERDLTKKKIQIKDHGVIEKIVVENKKLLLPNTSSTSKTIRFWIIISFSVLISCFAAAYIIKKKRYG